MARHEYENSILEKPRVEKPNVCDFKSGALRLIQSMGRSSGRPAYVIFMRQYYHSWMAIDFRRSEGGRVIRKRWMC